MAAGSGQGERCLNELANVLVTGNARQESKNHGHDRCNEPRAAFPVEHAIYEPYLLTCLERCWYSGHAEGRLMDAAVKEELRERAREDDRLYDQFAARLEATHRGQYVAIARTGELLVGPDDIAVLDEALAKFGRGNFAFRRIGERTLGRWRRGGD